MNKLHPILRAIGPTDHKEERDAAAIGTGRRRDYLATLRVVLQPVSRDNPGQQEPLREQ
ncbi:hypothetical protein AERO8C_120551 [Aeromonas veronii]|uniref:Uncharacterized protein n=1 Tax=Aeromonas veronii TaxID=654 RepID=A0A653KRZ8_AERVE|nr:hypothetical protein AERO8C_120551 [Aeromonas veronii]